jgi:hypothetical protein
MAMKNNDKTFRSLPAAPARQRGAVLIVGLVLLVPLMLVATAIAEHNTLDEKMAANQRDGMRALYIAESGAEQAIAQLLANGTYTMFNTVLANNQNPDHPNLDLNNQSFGGGFYTVTLVDNNDGDNNLNLDSDGRARLVSRGDIGTANREVVVVISRQAKPSEYAILTQKHLIINGNMQLTGTNSSVHSNTSIAISGNPTINGKVSSTGAITISGTPVLPAGMQANAAAAPIPHIDPADFRADANYIFTADCRVRRSDLSLVADLSSGNKWHGWNCATGDKWTMSATNPSDGLQDGFIYVEGNAAISGSPGGDWNVTLVTEGYIEVSGNPNFEAFGQDPTNPDAASLRTEVKDLLFIAGGDLKISGNPSQNYHGVMAAHQEVSVSGNPNYQGRIIAENGASQEITTGQTAKNLVDQNEFSGNPTHTNQGGSPWDPVGIRKISWRESS